MRLLKTLVLGAALALAVPAIAQEASPAITGWPDFLSGLWHTLWGYISNPLVVTFLMTQARAMFPVLGKLGVLTTIGDIVAGNWGAAKNAR